MDDFSLGLSWNGRFADPFFFGDYPATMRTRVRERLPKFTADEAKVFIFGN